VVGLDRLARRVDHAAVVDPPIPLGNGPLVQTDPIARLVVRSRERVQRKLTAWVIEKEIVRLGHVVNARAGSSGLDDVHSDIYARPKLLAGCGDHAL
jgi:hypothetical protein